MCNLLTICEVPGCPGGFLFSGTPPLQGHRCWGEKEVRATGAEEEEG